MKWRAVGFVSVVVSVVVVFAVAVYRADHYRANVHSYSPPPVVVAKQLIPKGTTGSFVLSQSMYAATTLPAKELEDGASAEPSYLNGHSAAVDIHPGQQLTQTNFSGLVPGPVVLVATQPILKGTPGSIVVAKGMYRPTVTPPQQREVGAISDPSYLTDRVSVAEIHLGQQLTEANFPARG
jgi:SAF domain